MTSLHKETESLIFSEKMTYTTKYKFT